MACTWQWQALSKAPLQKYLWVFCLLPSGFFPQKKFRYIVFYFLNFYFIFELEYINNMRGFHCDNSIHVDSVTSTSSSLPLFFYLPLSPSPFSNSVWGVSLCCLHMYILIYFDPLHFLSFTFYYSWPWGKLAIIFLVVHVYKFRERFSLAQFKLFTSRSVD
jgi:hypothetical protein